MAAQQFTLNRCVGKLNYQLTERTNWYGFTGKPIEQDTRCEYCRQHLQALGADKQLYSFKAPPRTDCDSLNDDLLSKLVYNRFKFSVTSPDKNTPFLVHPPKSSARDQGLFVVEMPNQQDYCVNIDPNWESTYPGDPNYFGRSDKLNYFTYSMKVGDREVIVNGGETIYYHGKISVNGFKTGTDNGFRFAACDSARARSLSSIHDPHHPERKSDVITITIKTFKREKPVPVYQCVCVDYSLDGGPRFDFGDRGFGGRGFGGPVPAFGSAASARASSLKSMELCDASNESELVSTTTPALAAATSAGSQPVLIGGHTESSGRHVPRVSTTTTTDKFIETGSFSVTIQLIHVANPTYQAVLQNPLPAVLTRVNTDVLPLTPAQLAEQQVSELERQRRLLVQVPPDQPVSHTPLNVTFPLDVPLPPRTSQVNPASFQVPLQQMAQQQQLPVFPARTPTPANPAPEQAKQRTPGFFD